MKPYLQPFERRLALSELAEVSGCAPEPVSGGRDLSPAFCVRTNRPVRSLAARLAYWEFLEASRPLPTLQILKESSVTAVSSSVPIEVVGQRASFQVPIAVPKRRCLRYGPHGLHEYRGKFFPQLVLSLMNIARVPPNGTVADPMCGSGTTAVEAVLAGCRAVAMDINPLSVFMTRTKCSSLFLESSDLEQAYTFVRQRLMDANRRSRHRFATFLSSLPAGDQEYLMRWFAHDVLGKLDTIVNTILWVENERCRDLLWLSLSNILRRVSWQKNDDLRVRREPAPDSEVDPIIQFLEELGRSVRTMLALHSHISETRLGHFSVQEGDARDLSRLWSKWSGKVDAVITSPPYATALPYIDTDRLSLIYLKLLPRSGHRPRDQQMIGNREITETGRREKWSFFAENKRLLPTSVVTLVEAIERLNACSNVGFRRRNLGALLSAYFFDMREVLFSIAQTLKPGAPAYIVVGNNRTIAGGNKVGIPTADLLTDIAVTVGLDFEKKIAMEMLVSRDIFRRNAVVSEHILCFRRPR